MILVEQASVSLAALPVAEFRDHLKLGRGFADDDAQDVVLESVLRSALSALEARVSKAIYRRAFLWKLASWRGFRREELPLAPVSSVSEIRIREADGSATLVPAGAYGLEVDTHRPCVVARGGSLPTVPVSGGIEIEFEAGYGLAWGEIPADLRRAVLMLAAHYHEHRHLEGERGNSQLPFGVASLLEPYRPVRLFGWRL